MSETASGTASRGPARIVITGASGQVGRFLAAEAGRRGHGVLALGSADCDITDPGAPERYVEAGDVVVNCAAYTDVDGAESDEAAAYAVNATGAENVAHACARAGARLLHISTDYVFGGGVFGGGPVPPRPYEPGDDTAPVNAYGRSKLAGELAVLAAMPDAVVVRTSWVYTGADGTDFAAAMRRRAERAQPTEVVDDQVGSPTYVADLVAALFQIAGAAIREPVLHAANAGAASRYEQARAVFAELGADPELVSPIDSARHPRPAPRPAYSALGGEVSAAAGLTPLRPWRDALAEALRSRPLPSTP
ncbi:dTDP-4-dehydrorhamnose reductase [Mycolicibacterium palauense]|uniref:dTDP-4-dehydrorhamnose reductase n=1 Tax=Mycolicibacterium palauense TaxID=2034511 RepID=UPI000BFF0738|nr:dTDP-4-dehydrorhamnose reductase [Mycolicibacterium palauense]